MASTTNCVKALGSTDLSRYAHLIDTNNGRNEWKRIKKFTYKSNYRRYFYLTNSCLLATVDANEVDGTVKTIVRPPMLWEMFMLEAVRNDIDPQEFYFKHEKYCVTEASKHSEPEQYGFLLSSDSKDYDDVDFVLFFPKLYTEYDQHIGQYIDHLVPPCIFEDSECCYSYVYDTLKQELIDLGFEYDNSGVY